MRAGYVRVSTEEQSHDRQLSILEDDVDAIYRDKMTGTTANRPQFSKLTEDIADGTISTVVAVESSRLARSLQDLLDFFDHCERHDTAVEFINGSMPDYDPQEDDPTATLIRQVIGAVNEFQANMVGQNVREAFAAKRERDEHIGRPPFGYEIGPEGHLVRVPEDFERAVMFIEEVKKGRPKLPTAEYFGVESAYQEILEQAEERYDIAFSDEEWQMERAKVKAGMKEFEPLADEQAADIG